MTYDEIHIDEENVHIFWGLTAIVSIAMATYMLINAFMQASWSLAGYRQIISLLLFCLGFYSIIKFTSPLYHFVLQVNDSLLTIEIWNEGKQPIATKIIELNEIKELRIEPHSPRLPNEALFDFSTSYHLLYRHAQQANFKKLIELNDKSFTLKVEDIRKIMQFLVTHNTQIFVPEEDALFIELDQSSNHKAQIPNS